MTSMTATTPSTQPADPDQAHPDLGCVYGGVDTHKDTHHAAVIDRAGIGLADAEFATGALGDQQMIAWFGQWPHTTRIAVEQTGTYGAGLTRSLTAAGYHVRELNAPDKTVRAKKGKDDTIDAYMAAEAARTGRATATPKDRSGIVESIRMIRATRSSAVKARSMALTQIQDLVVAAPAEIRTRCGPKPTGRHIMRTALSWRVDLDSIADPCHATKLSLRSLARRIRDLDTEITLANKQMDKLTATIAPNLRACRQVGPEVAAQLLITVGQCPTRIRTDAQFARLCGVAPIPASSGKTTRMRLHRGGDRQANCKIHLVAIGRLANYAPAIEYRDRRRAEKKNDKDIIRSMKRLIARELFTALQKDLDNYATPLDEL